MKESRMNEINNEINLYSDLTFESSNNAKDVILDVLKDDKEKQMKVVTAFLDYVNDVTCLIGTQTEFIKEIGRQQSMQVTEDSIDQSVLDDIEELFS